MGFYFSTIIFYRKLILINSVLLIFIELIIYANITPVFYEKAVPLPPRLSHKKLTCRSVEIKASGESINFSILA